MRTVVLALLFTTLACDRDEAHASAPPAKATGTAGADVPRGDAAGHAEPAKVETPQPTETIDPPPTAARVKLVDIDPDGASLHEQIVAAAAQAKADGRSVAVELWAGWCPPCKKLDKLLHEGPVADAAANAVLIRVDTDEWNDELNKLGFDAPQIPSLYRIDERGKPRGKALSGAKWTREPEATIAAQLAAFLAG